MGNVVVSVKMPDWLKSRIDSLAQKGLTNRNHWIVRTLTREAGTKGSLFDKDAMVAQLIDYTLMPVVEVERKWGMTHGGMHYRLKMWRKSNLPIPTQFCDRCKPNYSPTDDDLYFDKVRVKDKPVDALQDGTNKEIKNV